MKCPHCSKSDIATLSENQTNWILKCSSCSSILCFKGDKIDFSFIYQIIGDKKYLIKSYFDLNLSTLFLCPVNPIDTLILITEFNYILTNISSDKISSNIKNIINFS